MRTWFSFFFYSLHFAACDKHLRYGNYFFLLLFPIEYRNVTSYHHITIRYRKCFRYHLNIPILSLLCISTVCLKKKNVTNQHWLWPIKFKTMKRERIHLMSSRKTRKLYINIKKEYYKNKTEPNTIQHNKWYSSRTCPTSVHSHIISEYIFVLRMSWIFDVFDSFLIIFFPLLLLLPLHFSVSRFISLPVVGLPPIIVRFFVLF